MCSREVVLVRRTGLRLFHDPAGKVVKMYNKPGDVENRIKEGKKTLRWDKSCCRCFAANHARLLMGVLGTTSCTGSGNSISVERR